MSAVTRKRISNTMVNMTDEQRKHMLNTIHDFFDEEFGDDVGMLKQQKIMDLFMEQLAPVIYNKALDDAMYWYKRQMDNVEADFYELYKE